MSALSPPSPSPSPQNNPDDNYSENGKEDKSSSNNQNQNQNQNARSMYQSICPPPSFNVTSSTGITTTRPYYLFPLFLLINVATMTDRSIIAGASQEFSAFVSGASDSPALVKENPDAGIGILQAAFIFGYSIAILLSGHYVHTTRWKPLVFSGLLLWWLGVLGSGNAKQYDSFYVLLFSRMATGCSEAAFQVVAPPLIQDRGGERSGLWLSIYLMGLPVGLSLGYIYGSRMAVSERWGWDWAYYFMCIASLPLIVAMAFVKDEVNGGILSGAGEVSEDVDGSDGGEGASSQQPLLAADANDEGTPQTAMQISQQQRDVTTPHHPKQKFTLFSEMKACISSPVLVTLSLGWAAMIGVVASLGTFGGAFVLALQLFDDERDAAYWFGIVAALAGIIGTPLGGKLADKILKRHGAGSGGSSTTGGSSSGGEDVGVDDSMRYPIIASMVSRVNALVALSLLFVFPTLLMQDAVFFLTFLFIGWTLLFMTQTMVNLISMLAVDRCHRPNAVAFLMLTSHILGDVPLPIVLGLIKDKLAPSCRVGPSGDFADPKQCEAEELGIRKSLAIAYAWVLWALLFYELCRRFAKREIGKARAEEHNTLLMQEEEDDGTREDSAFAYYHSQFQPEGLNQSAGGDESSPLNGRDNP